MKETILSRWRIITNGQNSGEQRIFALLELLCFPVSMLTIFVLLPVNLILPRFGYALPGWWAYVSGVLLSAAVGYITNYIAVEMLFKPYTKSPWHPLSIITLGYWQQGLVPRSKDRIGVEIGRQVEAKLLNPEKMADELCEMVMNFIQNPAVVGKLSESLQRLLRDNEQSIISFVIPKIEASLVTAMNSLLTPERITQFWSDEISPVLTSSSNRQAIAAHIMRCLQRRSPQFTEVLKKELRSVCKDFLDKQLPSMLSLVVKPSTLADGFVDFIDWDDIEERISARIGSAETVEMLQDELLVQLGQLQEWLKKPEAQARVGQWVAQVKDKFRRWLSDYLRTALPAMANETLGSQELWGWFENTLMPNARPALENMIRTQGKEQIVAKLNLAQRVTESVEKQDVREFHEMVNSVAAQHLGAIQVMGYILGLIIGAIQYLC